MSDRLAAEVMSRPLAKGWQWMQLGQYVENLDGRRVPISQKEREKRRGDFPYYGASGVIDTIDGHTHDGEFVLIGEDGANLLTRSKPIAFQAKGKIWVNNHAHVLRCKPGFSNAYLAYYINSIDLSPYVTGTAQPKLSQSMMNKIPVPVAPPDQQIRIVAEIDKQFSRLDEAVANLHRVKANLKRYKAAVLKAAVEGRLVETEASIARREGRSYETAVELIGKTPTPPRPNRFNSRTGDVIYGHGALAVGIPAVSVPEGWQWVNLVEIAKMESGHTPSRNHPEWWDGDVPWLGIADARDHHEQVILRTLQNTNDDGLANSAARLLPAGTVCVSRTASVGYVVVMGRPMATSQDFVNWVPTTAVTSDWLRIAFSADREALIRLGKGSVHKTIYFPEWLSASIALPPMAEQVRIAAEVDRRVSVLRSVEAELEANLRRAEALRRATLEKAFSAGEKDA